jgi:hypothetical protein
MWYKIKPMAKRPTKRDVVLSMNTRAFEEKVGAMESEEDKAMVVSGDLEVGKNGNPVTISVIDEVSGEIMEINHVQNALIVVEDKRSRSSGWLTLFLGDLDKVGQVVKLLAQASMEELRKIIYGISD